jgi:uncharacterized membrane protein YfcA
MFIILLAFIAIISGGVASIAGFGIGSLLTPFYALKMSASLAVACVCVAHFLGTGYRFLKWRKYINRKVLLTFGVTSAAGGLIGALLHNSLHNVILTIIFGCLLVFAGITGLTGMSNSWRLKGIAAWIAGALSGIFGGLVGNQGGIRSAAMFGFDLKGKEFVATATGIALAVDVARLPVYMINQWQDMLSVWPLIAIGSVGVLIGTEIGVWMLGKIPETIFKKVVSFVILIIGVIVLIS